MNPKYNWYLSSMGSDEKITPIPLNDGTHIGVYRQDDRLCNVAATVGDETVSLGVKDISVSGMREDGAPIRLSRDGNKIEIKNIDNKESIEIKSPGKRLEVGTGEQRSVSGDCAVKVGYSTELLLTSEIERDTPENKSTVEKSGEKISVSAYVQVLCRHFRQTSQRATDDTSDVSVGDVESCVRDIRNVVSDNPIDATGYEEVYERLDKQLNQLDLQNDGGDLTHDRVPRCKKLADDIEKLYSRN